MVFVYNYIAHHQHAQFFKRAQFLYNIGGGVLVLELLQKLTGGFRKYAEKTVKQFGGTEINVVRETQFSADRFHGLALTGDAAGYVFFLVRVVGAFYIHAWFNGFKGFNGGGPFVYGGVVHGVERGQRFRAQVFRKHRAARAFVYKPVGCYGDNQNIAFFFCGFKMADVARMHKVEHAVAKHHGFARFF